MPPGKAGTADDLRQLAIDGKTPPAAADEEGDAAHDSGAAEGKERVKGACKWRKAWLRSFADVTAIAAGN
jgi:hypothetical protein